MANFRLLLIRLKIHRLTKPLTSFFLKTGNFTRLSSWIDKHLNLEFNDYYSKNASYQDRYKLFQFIVEREIKNESVNYLEFGAADGETTKWWSANLKNNESRLYGFDTFEGLPEDWGIHKMGTFSNQGRIPEINDSRVKFMKGLFQETLGDFLQGFENSRKNIILLDADLYSSTLFVLTRLAPFLKGGDVIIFDEFLSPQHEFLAYINFSNAYTNIRLQPFGAANNYCFVAFRVS